MPDKISRHRQGNIFVERCDTITLYTYTGGNTVENPWGPLSVDAEAK